MDILGVIAVNHETLDREYLDHWAEKLSLTEALAAAWKLATEAT